MLLHFKPQDYSRLWSTTTLASYYFYTYLRQAEISVNKATVSLSVTSLLRQKAEKVSFDKEHTEFPGYRENPMLGYLMGPVSHPCLSVSLPLVQDSCFCLCTVVQSSVSMQSLSSKQSFRSEGLCLHSQSNRWSRENGFCGQGLC